MYMCSLQIHSIHSHISSQCYMLLVCELSIIAEKTVRVIYYKGMPVTRDCYSVATARGRKGGGGGDLDCQQHVELYFLKNESQMMIICAAEFQSQCLIIFGSYLSYQRAILLTMYSTQHMHLYV